MPTTNKEDRNQFDMLSVNGQIESAMSEQNEKFDVLNSSVSELITNDDTLNEYTKSQNEILTGISTQLGTTKIDTSEKSFSGGQAAIENLVDETKQGHSILGDIKNLLGGKSSGNNNDISGGNNLVTDLSKDSNKGMLTNIVMLVGLLGGAFLILGKSLNLLGDIDYKKYLIISASISLLFMSLSKILNTGITFKDVIAFGLFADIYATAIIDTLTKIDDSPDVSETKLQTFSYMTVLMIGSFGLINKFGILSFGQALGYNLSSTILAQSFVEISKLINNAAILSKEQLLSFASLALIMVPAYGLLTKLENEVSTVSSIAISMFGFSLPILARSLVATAGIIDQMPPNFNIKGTLMIGMLAIALYPFVTNAMNIFEKINMASGMDMMSIAMRKFDYTKGAGLSFSAGNSISGMNQGNLAIAMRLGMAFGAIPLLGLTMVTVAGMFHLYVKAGGTFVTPPTQWSVSVGLAMIAFSTAFGMIMFNIEPSIMRNMSKDLSTKHGKSIINEQSITKSNVPGTLAIMAGLAITMVVTAFIFRSFPKKAEQNMPDMKWSLSVGIGMLLFAKALKNIVGAMQNAEGGISFAGKGRSTTGKGLLQGSFSASLPQISGMLYMMSMAASIVAVAYIMKAFPDNPKAPDIKWVLGVGLAMYIFTKAYSNITQVTKSSGGLFGGKTVDVNSKSAFSGLLFMNLIAFAIIGVALILNHFPDKPKSPDITWTISVGLALLMFAKSISLIVSMANKIDVKGKGNTVNIKDGNKQKGIFGTLVSISLSIVATAYIFKLLPDEYKVPDVSWILKTGLALVAFTIPLMLLIKATNNNAFKNDNVEDIKNIGKKKGNSEGILSKIIMISLGIVAIATVFRLLPDESNLNSPAIMWTIKTMTALLAFTGGMILIQNMLGKSVLRKRTAAFRLELINISLALVAIAWITKLLPTEYKSPDIMWSIKVGISMLVFGAAILALSLLDIGPKDLTLGMKTMAVIALSIVGLAWIFKLLPDEQKAPSLLFITFTVIALLAIGGAIALLGKMNKNIEKGSFAMTLIVLPIATLALGMFIWTKYVMSEKPADTLISIGLLVGTIMSMAFISYFVGKAPLQITVGLLVISLIALPIMLLAYAMKKVNEAITDPKEMGKKLLVVGAAITIIGLAALGIGAAIISTGGLVAADIALGLGAIALTGLTLIPLAKGISAMDKAIDLNKSSLFKNSQNTVFGIPISNFANMMTGIAYGMAVNPITAIGMQMGVKAFDGVSEVLLGISKSFVIIGKLSPRTIQVASENLPKVLNSIGDAFQVIGIKNGSHWFFNGPIQDGIESMKGAGIILGDIATGVANFAKMRFTNSAGEVVTLAEGDLTKVNQNIIDVMTSVSEAFKIVGLKNKKVFSTKEILKNIVSGGGIFGVLKMTFGKGPVADGIQAVSGAGAILTEVAKGLADFAVLKFKDPSKKNSYIDLNGKLGKNSVVGKNIIEVLDTISQAFATVGKNNSDTKWGKIAVALSTGGFTGMILGLGTALFGKGDTASGIEAVAGAGALLSEISSGVAAFAGMSFTGADGKPILLNEAKLKETKQNITDVISLVGSVFGDLGKNYDTWFSNDVKKGVAAISGAGTELMTIASSVKDFASLKFGDITFKEEELGEKGTIGKRISTIVTTVSSIFATLEKTHGTTFGNDTARGIKAIAGAGQQLYNISLSVEKLSKINLDDKNIENLKTKIPVLLNIIPNALIDAIKVLNSTGTKLDGIATFNLMNTTIINTVDKLVKYEKPLDSIAKSFKTISSSMSTMGTTINELDTMKLEKLNGTFNSMQSIVKPGQNNTVSESIDNYTKKIDNKIDKITTPLKNNSKYITEEKMVELFDKLTMKLSELNSTMSSVKSAFSDVIDVNITNKNVLGN